MRSDKRNKERMISSFSFFGWKEGGR